MYVNLNQLVHNLTSDLFMQTFMTTVPDNPEAVDEKMVAVLAKFCEIDMLLSTVPDAWVEIQGNEDYVKHSLLDIS